jgi:predicted RNA-binding Zn ribbon-like protein
VEEQRRAPGRLELVREFINTADIAPREDELVDLGALRSWLRGHELIGPREQLADGDLERALAVREALRAVVEARAHASTPDIDAVAALNRLTPAALLRVAFDADGAPALEPVPGGLDGALAQLMAIIGFAAVEGTWLRLKVCADHGCRWAFYDHSKNRSRSWCNMAVCGNRAKAREYRRRRRSSTANPQPAKT